jgi:hypothetical protein
MFGIRAWLLRPLHIHLFNTKGFIMEALDTLNAKVDDLAVAVPAALADQSAKIDALKAQITELQAAGGATPADLAAVSAKVDAIKAGLTPAPVVGAPIA